MLLFCTPFVGRTDLATLDIPHQPSIQEETESEFSPVSSPIKSSRSAPPVDAFAAPAASSSHDDPADANHLPIARFESLSANPSGISQPIFTLPSAPSHEKLGMPKVPSSENLGHV